MKVRCCGGFSICREDCVYVLTKMRDKNEHKPMSFFFFSFGNTYIKKLYICTDTYIISGVRLNTYL